MINSQNQPFLHFSLEQSLLNYGKNKSLVSYILCHKKEFTKKKVIIKNDKSRTIYPTYYGLKSIQELLSNDLSKLINFPPFIHGSVKGKSQKTNASVHINKKYVLTLDIRNFFPSIKKDKILNCLIDNGMNHKTAEILTELFTYRGSLQIGPPSSPFLANLVFLPVDNLIIKFCNKNGLTYSRYVDDITISSNKKIHPYYGTIKKYIHNFDFELANEKTLFMGRNTPQLVTKIVVNDKLRPKSSYITRLKKDIRIKTFDNNTQEDIRVKKSLRGKINYLKQYDKKKSREVRALMVKSPKNTLY